MTSISPTVLVCDDESAVRFAIEEALEALGVTIVSVDGPAAATSHLGQVDVVITDLVMPETDGFAFLAACRTADPDLPVVMLTARGNERTAVRALKEGAYDYLGKPFSVDELRLSVSRALEVRALRKAASRHALDRLVGASIVGESPPFRRLLDEARRIGRRDVTVLVRGETGTGKELVASMLHASSARRDGPCVRFNCAALAEGLAEAELFGHVKGAFTGASSARAGYFRQADGGTLVLDEIGELALSVQAKLLRALQEHEIQPVGADRVEKIDVRVVACTHKDLRAEASTGRFREDLYYRIAVVELLVPSLRERREDIPLLVDAFRRRWSARFDLEDVRLSPALVGALAAKSWPGNVRELENAVARLLALADPGDELGPELLSRMGPTEPGTSALPLREQVGTYERGLVAAMLAQTNQNQSEAARRLGISRMTLIEKMKRFGLKP
jgi:two-component system response regulator AtoC